MVTELQQGLHQSGDPDAIVSFLRSSGVLDEQCRPAEQLSGTTSGQVHVIARSGVPAYILKFDAPEEVAPVVRFLAAYGELPLLPKLAYVDPLHRYFVYGYVSGNVYDRSAGKANWLTMLTKQCIVKYETVPAVRTWGWTTEPVLSWRTFLAERIVEARKQIGARIADEEVDALIRVVSGASRYDDVSPYLLHGDCGVHNFIFAAGELAGVIDPTPVVGPPLYDLLYAFCSSPDELNPGTLFPAVALLNESGKGSRLNEEELVEELLIQLYCRIATCLIHHAQDLEPYLSAWQFWQSYKAALAAN